MVEARVTRGLARAVQELLDCFREGQPTGFVASEPLASSETIGSMNPQLAKTVHMAEAAFPRQGFARWKPPAALRDVIQATRVAVGGARARDGAIRLPRVLLTTENPSFLTHVRVE